MMCRYKILKYASPSNFVDKLAAINFVIVTLVFNRHNVCICAIYIKLTCRKVLEKKLSNRVHLHDRLESTECLGYVSLS